MSILTQLTAPLYGLTRWLYQEPALVASSAGGSDSLPARELYDAKNALSAMAAFPWVMACFEVISTDLSGLPLVAVEMGPDGSRTILPDHPVLDLLRRPSVQCSGVSMRRQLYTDFTAVREAYIRVMGRPGLDGVAIRIHPKDIEPQINPSTGLIDHYLWGAQKIPPGEILMIRGSGWETGIRASRAESPIHSLQEGLLAARDARRHARESAKRGQIQMLLKPSDPVAQFGQKGVDAIRDMYLRATQAGHGLLVLNRALEATPLSLSPRELEFSQLYTDVRDEVLAVLGVPPVLVGLPGANYGTARQQARTYWERRKHDARLFDDEFSRLTGNPRIRIEHDFTDVEALQTSRSERQARASLWVTAFGMSPADAASYEGFDDIPAVANSAADVAPMRPQGPGDDEIETPRIEPGGERGSASVVVPVIRVWLSGAAERYQAIATEMGEDGIPDTAQAIEAGILRILLLQAGIEGARPHAAAATAALTVHDAVSTFVDTRGADAVLGVRSLRCFGRDFADHLATAMSA